MMSAGRGNLERALGAFLALDVAQVEQRLPRARAPSADGRDSTCVPLKWLAIWISELAGDDLDIRARPGRFRPHARGTDQAFVARIGADRRRQYAGHRRDRSIEPEFAEHREAAQRIRRNGADRRHQAERDRQIVMAALLRQVGGREIDRDPPRRQRQTRGDQRRGRLYLTYRDSHAIVRWH